MVEIDTTRIIAPMANKHVARIFISKLISHAVGADCFATQFKFTVTVLAFACLPLPAIINPGNLYFAPKSLHLWFIADLLRVVKKAGW